MNRYIYLISGTPCRDDTHYGCGKGDTVSDKNANGDVLHRYGLELLADRMRSADVAIQRPAVEDAAAICQSLADLSVSEFQNSASDSYLVAEVLGRFGSLAIRHLEQVFVSTSDLEKKTLAAVVLLNLGSSASEHWLLENFMNNDSFVCLAARCLCAAGVGGTCAKISEYLQTVALPVAASEPLQYATGMSDKIVCLLRLLLDANYEVPASVVARWSVVPVVEIQDLVKRFGV